MGVMHTELCGRRIEVNTPERVLFPEHGVTKRRLVDYYAEVAETMWPHVRDRVVSMQRFPDGIGEDGFYQKRAPEWFPDWVRTLEVAKQGGTLTEVVLAEPATLPFLAAQACITPHTWLSRADDVERPDRLVFDLDPPDDDFDLAREAARRLRPILAESGLEPGVMTTGSRGLHVVAPLVPEHGFDRVRSFARAAAARLVATAPERFTTEIRKEKRGRRLFVDTLRNAYAQTSVPPYAVRARPGAPVAVPLDWDELGRSDLDSRHYTIANLFRRLGQKRDPWSDIEDRARPLPAEDDLPGAA